MSPRTSPVMTRRIIVENASAAPQLAHVVIWSDRGVPVHDFDLYLTAHEQQTIGMRALLSGTRPASSAGSSAVSSESA